MLSSAGRRSTNSRLKFQADHAEVLLHNELLKRDPRDNRVRLLKKCARMANRWRKDHLRLLHIIFKCGLKYIPAELAKNFRAKWPDDGIGMHYYGYGMVQIYDGKQLLEMRISQAAWKLRRADSELGFLVALYGDLRGIW